MVLGSSEVLCEFNATDLDEAVNRGSQVRDLISENAAFILLINTYDDYESSECVEYMRLIDRVSSMDELIKDREHRVDKASDLQAAQILLQTAKKMIVFGEWASRVLDPKTRAEAIGKIPVCPYPEMRAKERIAV